MIPDARHLCLTKILPDNISQSDTEIISDTSVDSDLLIIDCVIWEYNAYCFSAALALQQNCVSTK